MLLAPVRTLMMVYHETLHLQTAYCFSIYQLSQPLSRIYGAKVRIFAVFTMTIVQETLS